MKPSRISIAAPGKILKAAWFILAVQTGLLAGLAGAKSRRIGVGEEMPEFSAIEAATGETYTYEHGAGKATMVVFLSTGQDQSKGAAAELIGIFGKLAAADANELDFVVVVDKQEIPGYLTGDVEKQRSGLHIVVDSQYKLWGKFGVIATPTVFIGGKDDKVAWVQPGYGYDFAPVVRSHLNQTLGIAQKVSPEDAGKVKTLTADSVSARAHRHLRMAKLLQQKGDFEAAMSEVCKSRELDPNSADAALTVAELHCHSGRGQAALQAVAGIRTSKQTNQATISLIVGWASRLVGELEKAEECLLEATKLDPKSERGFFELGKVYQATGRCEEAMETYRRALDMIFARHTH